MDDRIQDQDLAKADLRDFERLKSKRAPWEETYREIDDRFPDGAGGFNEISPGRIRGERNYDTTHITALERFAAAGVAITTPQERDYIRVRFLDADLMQQRNVKLWCEKASMRLYAIRHAVHTGFGVAANEDWEQLGRYGTSVMLADAKAGRGMYYRTVHLSESYIDVDCAGQVDTLHRCRKMTARQLAQQFRKENLTPKMTDALTTPGKEHTEFEILHIVAPNTRWDPAKLDHRRFPIASRYLAVGEKIYLRRRGFHTQPLSCSRHVTSPGEIYGRSPAIKMMPTINGVNAMRHTTLRAGHKAVDPALLFADDMGVTSLVTRPGGLNPGLVNERGQPMAHRMPGGETGLPYAMEMIEQERGEIKTAFLEEFYKILTDPNSRMTTTEVLEVMSKQGILVRPFASRYETEKQDPVSQRELDLALRAGQIDPFPPEVVEAGAWPAIEYENMLAAMARAESTAKSLRFVEALTPFANVDPGVLDYIDTDAMVPGMAREIGVKPSYIRDARAVAAIRAKRGEDQQRAIDADLVEKTAGATLDLAKAAQVSEGG